MKQNLKKKTNELNDKKYYEIIKKNARWQYETCTPSVAFISTYIANAAWRYFAASTNWNRLRLRTGFILISNVA